MALEEITVSLNLGQGVDQKDNEFVGDPQSFLDLKNMVYNKTKELDKRPGTNKLTTSVLTSFPNPLTIGTSVIPSGVATHRDQLLLQNKGVLYSYLENESKWKFVGHQYPIGVEVKTAASLQQSIIYPNMGKIGNVSVYVFIEQVESLDGTLTQNLKYSVLDELSQSYIVENQLVETLSGANDQISYPQVVTFASACYLVWLHYPGAANNQASIRIASVSLTTGALGAVTSLKTDAKGETYGTVGNPAATLQGSIDWVYTNKVGVGERAFLTYFSYSGASSPNSCIVFSLKNDGTVDATMGSLVVSAAPIRGFGIHYNVALDRLFIGYQTGVSNRTFAKVASFTTSAITSVTDIQLSNNDGNIHAITFCDDPNNSSQVYAIWDVFLTDYIGLNRIFPTELCYAIISASAVISSVVPWGRAVSIMAKPISDTLRNTVYVPVAQKSQIQDTLFLADLKRGKAEDSMFAQAKWEYGDNFTSYSCYVPSMISLGSNKYAFPSMRAARINDLSSLRSSALTPLLQTFITDVARNEINLVPEFTSTKAFLNNGTHFSGGYLGYYDGAQFCEHSFFLNPEYLEAVQSATDDRVTITVLQVGDGSHVEIFKVVFPSASAMLVGPKYWTFDTSTTSYYIWYTIAGVGTDPVVGGKVSIPVVLVGNESSYEVAVKTAAAISQVALTGIVLPVPTTQHESGASITVTGTVIAAVVAPSSANYQQSTTASTSVPTGTYQYCAIWTWVDNNGLIMRSGVSSPITFTVPAAVSQPVAISLYVPPITNRSVAECKIELYRTTAGPGNTFFRVYASQYSPSWTASGCTISIIDQVPDTAPVAGLGQSLASQQELYTTGGVLGNYQIPAFKSLSIYKDRLVASGMNESEVYYSKTAVINQPIEFAAELLISTDQDGEQVTGHGDLDDKLVIFKEKKAIYYAGDGANDLGQNSTFSQPVRIASDVGCVNQASIQIVPAGIIFKSIMGLQLLDRGTAMHYIGVQVKDYNSSTVSSGLVLRDDAVVRQARFSLQDADYTLVYDYLVGKWTVFNNYSGTDAVLWKGDYTRCAYDGGVYVEDKTIFTDTGSLTTTYLQTLETQWLKIKNVQDFQRVWWLSILGALKSHHILSFKVYYDYDETNFDSYSFDSASITGSNPGDSVYQPQIHLARQKCQSIKIIMTVTPTGSPNTEECVTLVDLSFLCGVKKGLNKVKAGKQL